MFAGVRLPILDHRALAVSVVCPQGVNRDRKEAFTFYASAT